MPTSKGLGGAPGVPAVVPACTRARSRPARVGRSLSTRLQLLTRQLAEEPEFWCHFWCQLAIENDSTWSKVVERLNG